MDAIRTALEPLKISYEIVITDDCSTDSSWNVLQALAAKDPRVRALRHAKNAGQSAAVWTAIKNTSGKYIATLDADLQNDPADLPQFLEAIKYSIASAATARPTAQKAIPSCAKFPPRSPTASATG